MSCATTEGLVEKQVGYFLSWRIKCNGNDLDRGSVLLMPLVAYLQTLWAFLQAVHYGMVEKKPYDETQLSYLRLSASGTWEIISAFPGVLTSIAATDIVIPLVLPLSRIILTAHVGTQWVRSQPKANMAALRS